MYGLGLMRRWMLAQDLREPPMPDHPGKPQVIPPELIPLAEQMARDRKERETYLPRFRAGIQAANGIAVRYRLYVPNGMEKGKRYPLVLFLHGIGECGDDNVAPLVASDGGVGWVAAQDRGEMGLCFVLVPQCPYPIPGLRWEEEYLTLVEQALREVEEHFPVDRNRICLTGLSLGGFAVWNLVRMYPDRFAAAVTCCAGCLRGTLANHEVDESGLRECVPALEKIPLWMFHSADDPTVPVSVTKTMDAALRKLGRKDGPDYHVTIYPAEAHYGHACWVPAFQNPALRHWVMEQIEAGTAET